MGFSVFDKRLLAEGLAWFERPRLATLLEELGTTPFERVETLAAMLRNGAPEEVEEAVTLFERVLARVEDDRPARERGRRRESAAERRARRYGG
jgi:hypothetical protein